MDLLLLFDETVMVSLRQDKNLCLRHIALELFNVFLYPGIIGRIEEFSHLGFFVPLSSIRLEYSMNHWK